MLGQIPETKERDAVHVAIIPMEAGELLLPGQRVGITDGKAGAGGKIVGIVDPFLTDVVSKGTTFWLCLLPNTVTGMRHHWEHPDFNEVTFHPSKEKSEQWLRNFAYEKDYPFESLVEEALTATGDYLVLYQTEVSGEIPDKFWSHLENYTGKKVRIKSRYFSCSC